MASPKVSAMMTRHLAVSWPEKRIPRLSTAALLACRRARVPIWKCLSAKKGGQRSEDIVSNLLEIKQHSSTAHFCFSNCIT